MKPHFDLSGNCVADEAHVEIMANEWLDEQLRPEPTYFNSFFEGGLLCPKD
jgi:hypothetical protein